MKSEDYFFKELRRQSRVPHKDYGDAVIDSAKIFAKLSDASEVVSLKEAMSRVLTSEDERLARWGRAVFAGYGRYTNIIARPEIVEDGAPLADISPQGDAFSISDGLEACARGHNIPAAIELYANVRSEDAKTFFDTLETFLSSTSVAEREFGIDLSVTLVLRGINPPWARR